MQQISRDWYNKNSSIMPNKTFDKWEPDAAKRLAVNNAKGIPINDRTKWGDLIKDFKKEESDKEEEETYPEPANEEEAN
jgi:hypothetical protein